MQARKKHFTLFELLISLSLLMVISVVVLSTLAMTTDLWSYSNEQSNTYLDNKVAFNLLGEELSAIVYNYDHPGDSDSLFAPVYISNDIDVGSTGLIEINGTQLNRGTALCFVTHTMRGNDAENSDICKVAYIYLPPRQESANVYTMLNEDYVFSKKNGVLLRIAQDEDDSSVSFAGGQSVGSYDSGYFNFDLSLAQQVVEGVIDFKVVAYKYNSGSKQLEELTSSDIDTIKGSTNICAVRVSMTLLPPNRCEEYRNVIHAGTEVAQLDYLQKYARTFSRTFWIRPVADQN